MPTYRIVNELIGKIHRAMRHFFECQMKRYNITPPQFEVLMTLWKEDRLSLTELGRRLSRDGPTITGIIDRMEKKNIVTRVRSNEDRRVIRVHLTQKAKKMKEDLMKMQRNASTEITEDLSEQDIILLEKLLQKILKNIEDKIVTRQTP